MIHHFPIGPIEHGVLARARLNAVLSLLLNVGVLAVLTGFLRADLNGPGTSAPRVEDISGLEVVRGKALRIKLEASTESPQRMEFIIDKSALRQGTLTDAAPPHPERKHITTVDYRPKLTGPDAVETFTYMVRQPRADGAFLTSSAATVTVRVLKAYPELVVDEVLQFGEIFVGSQAERVLTVSNKGGAPFVQKLEIPPGFTAAGLAKGNVLELPARSTRHIQLFFQPDKIGRVQHKLRYTGHKGQSSQTLLYATGIAPFHCAPSRLRLEWSPEDATRIAKLELTSSMDAPIVVTVTAPPQLELPRSITLDPLEARVHDIKIPLKSHREAVVGDIRLSFQEFEQVIPVEAAGVPAYLEMTTGPPEEQALEFPEGDESDPVTMTFVNAGTREGTLFADIHHGFRVEGVEEGQVIAPGEKLELTLMPAHNIRAEGTFVLRCGSQRLEYTVISEPAKGDDTVGGKNAKVTVDASTTLLGAGGGAVPSRRNGFSSYVEERMQMTGKELAFDDFTIKVEGNYTFDHSLPKVTMTEFIDGGRRFLEFSWEPLSPGSFEYKLHVKTAHFDSDTRRMLKLWSAVKTATIEQRDGKYVARVDDLNPSMAYHFRIVGVTPDGRASLSEPFRFLTAVPRPLRYLLGTWSVILLVVASIGILIHRKVKARRFYQRYY